MKIVIEHNGVKRTVNGALNLCGSGEDLLNIAEAIFQATQRDSGYYGWVHVPIVRPKFEETITNTAPIDWKEQGE